MEWHKKLENKKLQKYFCFFAGGVKCVWKRIFTEVVARGVGEHEWYAAAKRLLRQMECDVPLPGVPPECS